MDATATLQPPRPKTGDRVKAIGWAYPTSENAKLFGYAKTGCWTLSEGIWPKPLTAVAGCGHIPPLRVLGDRLEGVWSPYSMA